MLKEVFQSTHSKQSETVKKQYSLITLTTFQLNSITIL